MLRTSSGPAGSQQQDPCSAGGSVHGRKPKETAMRARLTLIGMGLAVLTAAVPLADAGTSCTVLTDPVGDVRTDAQVAVPDGHLDITSLAVATSGSQLTLIVRHAALAQ